MLTVEIKVNSQLIGYISITNTGVLTQPKEDVKEFIYDVEYFQPGKGSRCGQVIHNQEDEVLVLIQKSVDNLFKNVDNSDLKEE